MIVIGAGISGLASALAAHRSGRDVLVLERENRVGGAIRTERTSGYQLEWGPHSLVSTGREGFDLADSLGLEDQLLKAQPVADARYVHHDGALVKLPRGPLDFLRSSLLSPSSKLAVLAEPWRARRDIPHETVRSFFSRRLSAEWVDRMVDPFVSGIYAGRPERLEMESAFPRVAGWESRFGSILRGAWASRPKRGSSTPSPKARRGTFSFQAGMGTLPDRAASELPSDAIQLGVTVERIARHGAGWSVEAETESGRTRWETDRLVLAVPAPIAARIVRAIGVQAAPLATELARIPYAPIALVQVGLPTDRLPRPLDGFGFLVPKKSNLDILGAIWASSVFPGRAPVGSELLTAFVGGWTRPEYVRASRGELLSRTIKALGQALGGEVEPAFTAIQRWAHAIPQYVPGHAVRRARIEAGTAALPGLALAGNYLDGVSVHQAIARGQRASGR